MGSRDVEPRPQLLTYPDSLGGGLPSLADLLEDELDGLFSGVHILPPFPSSADRGFKQDGHVVAMCKIKNLRAVPRDQFFVGGDHVFAARDGALNQFINPIYSSRDFDDDFDFRIVD